jgi:hypothetical protein
MNHTICTRGVNVPLGIRRHINAAVQMSLLALSVIEGWQVVELNVDIAESAARLRV